MYISTYFKEDRHAMNVANADLTSHNPVSPSTTNAWHADVLTIESSLLHLVKSNLNSDICKKEKIYINENKIKTKENIFKRS